MKKLLVILVLALGTTLVTNPAVAQMDTSVGVGLAYNGQTPLGIGSNSEIGVKADVVLGFSDSFKFASDFSYFFPEFGTLWTINGNLHWAFMNKSSMDLYALGGVNHYNYDIYSSTGLNLGAGAEFGVGFGSIYIEPKYVLGTMSGFTASGGLRFGL